MTAEDIFDVTSRFRMMANTIWDKVGLEYDIFALHTIWNKAEVERTLGPGAVFITILRDPVQLFESLWVYVLKKIRRHKIFGRKFKQKPKPGP